MNRKLVMAGLAGIAAVALAVGGSTFSAWSDFGTINNNTSAAGFLKLDLTDGPSGVATPMNFDRMYPGQNAPRMVWVASNDGQSVPDANLKVSFKNLDDQENNCSSSSESVDDPTCGSNAPNSGELSKVVTVQTQYYPDITSPQNCSAYDYAHGQGGAHQSIFPADGPGDLYGYAEGTGSGYQLKDAANPTNDLVLHPGDGVCIAIDVYWAHDPHSGYTGPSDNAAQGDSMTFDLRFDLTHV
jgi:hypothetical protein